MFWRYILEVVHHRFYIGMLISRGGEFGRKAHVFFAIVDGYQYDGHLSLDGDVVKAALPTWVAFAGTLGGDGHVERLALPIQFGYMIREMADLAAVDGYTAQFFQQIPKDGHIDPFLFDDKIGVAAKGCVTQLTPDKIPVTGVRGNDQDAFFVVGGVGTAGPTADLEHKTGYSLHHD